MKRDVKAKAGTPLRGPRFALLVALDAVITLGSYWLALWLRFDGAIPHGPTGPNYLHSMVVSSPAIVGLVLLAGVSLGVHDSVARYASLRELVRLVLTVTVATVVILAGDAAYDLSTGSRLLPFSVPVVASFLLLFGLGLARLYARLAELLTKSHTRPADAERVLIVGAGSAGEHIVRDLQHNWTSEYRPVGFVDDDPHKLGRRIHGLPVLAPTSHFAEAVQACKADSVIIALPTASSATVQEVLARVAQTGLKAKLLPSLREMMSSTPTASDLRDVDISDLIARVPTRIDISQIATILDGRTVLITGAAGSIGSELVRKTLYFRPARVVVLDNNETELFLLVERLKPLAATRETKLEMVLADIRDRPCIDRVFARYRPQVVLHAAAYKHVPVMERHPEESVITNITGTRNVAEAAAACNAERFVLVSTDKAVNPTSVMGATKRAAEMLIARRGHESSTKFMAVRFGNVLASRGSVVPIFLKQIREGGPITVTHAEVTRYFMTIEEAVALILQAAALGEGGETFVLEMGEPVRIIDLADRMRRLMGNGLEKRIDIVVTGLRPGEKLHEDLFNGDDDLVAVHPGILRVARPENPRRFAAQESATRALESVAAERSDPVAVAGSLFQLVSPAPAAGLPVSPLSPADH